MSVRSPHSADLHLYRLPFLSDLLLVTSVRPTILKGMWAPLLANLSH